MFSASSYVSDVLDIPPHWIFETYLGVPPLTGNTVRIKSMFNPEDKTPSMYLFFSKQERIYMWKCFSTGKSGSAVQLMMELWDLSFGLAADKIRQDYQNFVSTGKRPEPISITAPANWKVSSHVIRPWNTDDAEFWPSFNIGSDILNFYNVRPLSHYFMRKDHQDLRSEAFRVSGRRLYGYFTKEGTLYKVYQPERTPKALKVCDYLQGNDQIRGYKTLILTSSLKDIMAVESLPLIKADKLANDSESVLFTREQLQWAFKNYEFVCTLMDSDKAGIKSMQYYNDEYGIPFIYLPQEKDPSDMNKFRGYEFTQNEMVPKLIQASTIYRENKEKIKQKLYNL